MSTIKTTTLSNLAGTSSIPTDTVINGSAKAWVNFNGTGTVAIRASFNVSSITDNGTGDYTVNFTTAITDANYSSVTGMSYSSLSACPTRTMTEYSPSRTASSVRVISGYTFSGGFSTEDVDCLSVAIFR